MASTTSISPPGAVNLTIAILALVGATLSIVGFISHYIPQRQYADFCDILHDIHCTLADNEWQWPSDDKESRLWHSYRSVSANIEIFNHLVTTPWYRSAFHIPTAWRLMGLRDSASKLKIELIALSQIQRRKDIEKIIGISLPPTSTTGTSNFAPSSRWWRWSKAPQTTTRKAIDDCERLPV